MHPRAKTQLCRSNGKKFFNVNLKSDMKYGNLGSKEFADFELEAAS